MNTSQSTTAVKKITHRKGIVVSDAMDKTIVVTVEKLKTHPKYLKKYKSTKRFKVHDPHNTYKVGDVVLFQECRPLSRGKRHIVVDTKETHATQ